MRGIVGMSGGKLETDWKDENTLKEQISDYTAFDVALKRRPKRDGWDGW